MIYICRSFHNVGYFIGFLIIDCPELELESLKVGKAEKGGKKRKGGKRWKRRLWFCNQPFGKISVMIIISLHSFLTSKACQWQHVTEIMLITIEWRVPHRSDASQNHHKINGYRSKTSAATFIHKRRIKAI